MDKAHCSPGLHAAAGPGLAEECAILVTFLRTYTIFGPINTLLTNGIK